MNNSTYWIKHLQTIHYTLRKIEYKIRVKIGWFHSIGGKSDESANRMFTLTDSFVVHVMR